VSKNLDEIDLRILSEIQADGRITNVELAKRVGISPPPCLRRVRTLEEEGYIQGYRGLLDPRRLGFDVTVFASAVTPASLLDAIAPVFDFDTGAGNERIVFAGNQARIELSKIFANEVLFEVKDKVTQWGMDFSRFELPMGTVLMKSHPLLSRHGLYRNSMFVLDFDAITYVKQKGRPNGTPKDDVQAKDEDVRRGYIQTDGSMEVDYGGITMAYLGNVKST